MNERPTPETDAAAEEVGMGHFMVDADHARNLERERDEARVDAEKWRKLHDDKDELFKKGIAEVERERDKAQEDATNYFARIGELEKERDEVRDALAATKHYLTKERDEALAQIVQAECRAERFCQERDEARIAIIATLEENRHLADGDDCTLAKLKSVVPDWK